MKVLDDCVTVCELVCVSLGGGGNSCDVVAEVVGSGGITVVRTEVAVSVDWIGGTTRVFEVTGGSGVGIIVNEPILLEVELRAGGVKITGIDGATVGGAAILVVVGGGGGGAMMVGGGTMLVVVLAVVAVVLVVCASVISSPLPSHVCNSKNPRCAKSSTESLTEGTSSQTRSTTSSTTFMPSRHALEQRSPEAKSAWVHPMNGVLYAMLQSVGKTPFAMGWRSLRETAAAVETMTAKPHSCDGCLRLARAWAAILRAASVFPDCQLSILVEEIVIEPDWIPSHKSGPRAMCYRDES